MALFSTLRRLSLMLLCLLAAATSRAEIDTVTGRKAPRSESHRAARLAQYICQDLGSDREKANAIYNWITSNIRYDIKAVMAGRMKHDDVKRVLRTRKGVCEGYAYLFRDMCQAVGLQAVTVDGYARDWIFDNGDKLYVPRHVWNAVLIDGQWQLVDATWGAGGIGQHPGWVRRQLNKVSKNPVQSGKMRFAFHYDTSYFLPDPESFRVAHLPTDPIWQLTDTAMPVVVFEAGEGAVKKFNEISHPSQEKDLLGAAADYNELIRTYDYADRAFAFNPRYYIPMAMKEQIDAEVQIQFGDSINKIDPMPARYRYGKATHALAMSKEYLKQQQAGYSLEARELKQKNHVKYDSAKRYVREIRSDDKRLTAKCELKQKSAKSRLKQISDKQAALQRLVSDKAMKPSPKNPASPRAEVVAEAIDSANARKERLSAMSGETAEVEIRLQMAIAKGKTMLDSLANALLLSDSLLIQETIAHLRMHDVYDDDVITYSTGFKEARFASADTLQARYVRGYDSLLQYYDERAKLEYAALSLYKPTLRGLAKCYQNMAARNKYNAVQKDFGHDASNYANHLAEYRQSISGYSNVFGQLVKLYKRQDQIADYMGRAEEKRKAQEEQTLAKKEAFNKKEIKSQQAFVEKSMKRAKRMAS